MNRYDRLTLSVATALLLALCLPATAQPPRSLDDELLEDLRSEPLDEVDRELFDPQPGQGRAGELGDDGKGLDERLKQELGAAGVSEQSNPLLEIARQMQLAGQRILKNDSGADTQDLQTEIVKDLDAMIEQARKNCRQCKPGSSQKQQTAARRPIGQPNSKQGAPGTNSAENPTGSSNRPSGNGPGTTTDLEQVKAVIKDIWGQLPPGMREQMLQSPPEEFLPKYERLIEQYFRHLAEGSGE